MIHHSIISVIIRHDKLKSLFGEALSDILYDLCPVWDFDGKLWAAHFMSPIDALSTKKTLEEYGLAFEDYSGQAKNAVIVEVGKGHSPCEWLKIQSTVKGWNVSLDHGL